jgi:hypothetical protein
MEKASLLTVLNAIVIHWGEKRETRNEKRESRTDQKTPLVRAGPALFWPETPFSLFSFLFSNS